LPFCQRVSALASARISAIRSMNHHYTRDDLHRAIQDVGIQPGDTVSLQVSLGRLGLPADVERNYAALSHFVIDAFVEMLGLNGTICTLGISLYWATFRHHIEEIAGVPFRFAKSFTGIVREQGLDAEETWSYFAAPVIDNCQPNGLPLERKARDEGLARIAPV